MKKILTLSIALILIAGIVSLAESADIDTSDSAEATANVMRRHIVQSSNGTIVVLYQRGSGTDPGIRAKKSTDKGATWRNLSGGAGSTQISSSTSYEYSIYIDTSDNIYVAYSYIWDIYFNKLTYNGDSTWTLGSEKTVDLEDDNGNPSIVRESNGKIWVAYAHGTASGAQVVATYSTDDFQISGGTRTDVSSPQAGSPFTSYDAAITIRDGNPFIVFQDNNDGAKMKWSYWNVSSWSTPQQIPTMISINDDFCLTSVGATVHLVVQTTSGKIEYTYYDGTWHTAETLISGDWHDKPSLTTNDVDLWCFASIYYDDPNSSYKKYNIKYKKRSGSTWDADWTAITTDNRRNRYSSSPSISRAYVPLAWTDATGTGPYTVKFDSSVAIPDSTSPAAITDLTGLCNSGTGNVTLSWSTPGDDGWTGTLVDGSKYRIDYSTYSIAWSTTTYDVEIPTHSVVPYTKVSRTITGLTGSSTYYFRIWTADEVPNWSGLSNGATVWVNPILGVSISTDTYAFGTIKCATSTVSGTIITVTNDGNVTETYSVKCSSTTKWTPKTTPGPNEFSLQSAFHPSQPADSDLIWKADDILTESLQTCTTAVFSIDGTEHGKNVPPFNNNNKKLWFRLQTPLSTSTTAQQTITITISAQSP